MNKEGQEQAERAVEVYEELLRSSPRDRHLRKSLADSYCSLSGLQYNAGETKASLDNANRVIELQEPLWSGRPERRRARPHAGCQLLLASASEARRRRSRRGGRRYPEGRGDPRETLAHRRLRRRTRRWAISYLPTTAAASCPIALRPSTSSENEPSRSGTGGPRTVNPGPPPDRPLKNAGYGLICFGQPGKAEPLLREAEGHRRGRPISRTRRSTFV